MNKTTTIPFQAVKRETDKAICLRVGLGYCSSVGRTAEIWFPRSTVARIDDNEAEIASWIVAKKLEEFRAGGITPWFE